MDNQRNSTNNIWNLTDPSTIANGPITTPSSKKYRIKAESTSFKTTYNWKRTHYCRSFRTVWQIPIHKLIKPNGDNSTTCFSSGTNHSLLHFKHLLWYIAYAWYLTIPSTSNNIKSQQQIQVPLFPHNFILPTSSTSTFFACLKCSMVNGLIVFSRLNNTESSSFNHHSKRIFKLKKNWRESFSLTQR